MSTWFNPSRTDPRSLPVGRRNKSNTDYADCDLHWTDIPALRHALEPIGAVYIDDKNDEIQFGTRATDIALRELLGSFEGPWFTAEEVLAMGKRLHAMLPHLKDPYWGKMAHLFTLMGQRGIGLFVSR